MISWFRMFSAFPTGCVKPWRIVSTHQQLAQDLDRRRCIHGKGHKHDPLEGGLTVKSGFYNRNMAMAILSNLYPKAVFDSVPGMPTVPCGPTEHVPREANGMANVMAAVHKLLSRKEAEGSEEAQQAIKKEAEGIRARGVWDDSSVKEMHELIRDSKASGREVHLADLMVVSSIKNAEMGPGHQKHKARIVFRGDAVRDVGSGAPAFFKELHSLPSNLQSVHATIWYGLLAGHTCQQAYLQSEECL